MTYPEIMGGEIPPPPPPPQYPHGDFWPAHMFEPGRGAQLTSLVCGLIGVVLGLVPLFAIFALALGLVGTVFGVIAYRRRKNYINMFGIKHPYPTTMAKWGVGLSVASLLLGIIGAVIVNNTFNEVDNDLNCLDRATNSQEMDACVEP